MNIAKFKKFTNELSKIIYKLRNNFRYLMVNIYITIKFLK